MPSDILSAQDFIRRESMARNRPQDVTKIRTHRELLLFRYAR